MICLKPDCAARTASDYAWFDRLTMLVCHLMLDVVVLTEDLPEHRLARGQVGTVVESLAPDVFEVEFSDDEGRTYASLALRADQLLVLHYEPKMLS